MRRLTHRPWDFKGEAFGYSFDRETCPIRCNPRAGEATSQSKILSDADGYTWRERPSRNGASTRFPPCAGYVICSNLRACYTAEADGADYSALDRPHSRSPAESAGILDRQATGFPIPRQCEEKRFTMDAAQDLVKPGAQTAFGFRKDGKG
jgi:hypothetical protein